MVFIHGKKTTSNSHIDFIKWEVLVKAIKVFGNQSYGHPAVNTISKDQDQNGLPLTKEFLANEQTLQ